MKVQRPACLKFCLLLLLIEVFFPSFSIAAFFPLSAPTGGRLVVPQMVNVIPADLTGAGVDSVTGVSGGLDFGGGVAGFPAFFSRGAILLFL